MDYDVIKEQIDTAIENLDPAISTADGTVVSLVVAGAAVPIAGCYGYAESVARKPFPDQCNKSDLFHHAVLKEIPFTTDIEEDVLREKVLSAWNYPPTGGGESDWDTLAASVCSLYSEKRFCVRDIWEARGLGTVDVAIGWSGDSLQLESLRIAIAGKRALGLADVQCSIAIRRNIEIKIVITGKGVDSDAVSREITSRYGESSSFMPAASIYRSKIESIGVMYGADNATMSWRNVGDTDWNISDCLTDRSFVNLQSVYEHLVVTSVVAEVI